MRFGLAIFAAVVAAVLFLTVSLVFEGPLGIFVGIFVSLPLLMLGLVLGVGAYAITKAVDGDT